MSIRRSFLPIPLFIGVLGLLLFQGCTDTSDPMTGVEPQLAKGGKPGKPTDPPEASEPQLEEFWVYSDADAGCDQMIHMVASGEFIRLGKGINHDYFFNAVRDDDPPVELHFEYGFGGPKTPPTEFRTYDDGVTYGHADVCFDGIRHEYVDEFGNVTDRDYFVNSPVTAVAGTDGADPFAISPAAVTVDEPNRTGARRFRPMGVVEDGVTRGREGVTVRSTWHDQVFEDVSSYAVHKGPDPLGTVSFQALGIDRVACRLTTETVGKGKDRTTVTVASISADVTIGYEGSGYYNQHFWGEGHIRVFFGADEYLSGRIMTPQTSTTFSVASDLGADLSGQTVSVEFVADFLHPMTGMADEWPGAHYSEIYDWAYDPAQNDVLTTIGFSSDLWGSGEPSSVLDDGRFPVAHSNTVTGVVCH